ncbi:MAG: nucleotidyl transferase AbiEii/AbiGii toxin family protein [Patescibacteria group bacterium]|nr:nucleotidyl transferase AbiEii/AbiGii toxin family protein [Patescibacteria group bacterium]
MITADQIKKLVKQLRVPESVIFREYLQLLFLESLYQHSKSSGIIFKGGTAIHLIYKAPRFSEDLDFNVLVSPAQFTIIIKSVFANLFRSYEIAFKARKTITGKRYLLTASPMVIKNSTYVNLDFSFREKTLTNETTIITTDFPFIPNSLVHHMNRDEIVAEKIRAILTRRQGRDIYDLWYLLSQGASLNLAWIEKKLSYYHKQKLSFTDLPKRIKSFPVKSFVQDLRPFVSVNDRDRLIERYQYITTYLSNMLNL